METPSRPPRALIFDLDDTLAWISPVWQDAERRLLRSIEHPWSEALARKYKGMNTLDLAAVVHRELQPHVPLPDLQQRMRQLLIECAEAAEVRPVHGSRELISRVQPMYSLAVASGSPPVVMEMLLERLGMADAFELTLSSEAVARGKPQPDVFLAAAKGLDVAPSDCLVFEDSLVGATAARAAGMACFVVPSLPEPAMATTATRVFANWDEVQPNDVAQAWT